jgi:hypothetical protein
MKEETGIDCEITGLVGIYTDPQRIVYYTSASPTAPVTATTAGILALLHGQGRGATPNDESRRVE